MEAEESLIENIDTRDIIDIVRGTEDESDNNDEDDEQEGSNTFGLFGEPSAQEEQKEQEKEELSATPPPPEGAPATPSQGVYSAPPSITAQVNPYHQVSTIWIAPDNCDTPLQAWGVQKAAEKGLNLVQAGGDDDLNYLRILIILVFIVLMTTVLCPTP